MDLVEIPITYKNNEFSLKAQVVRVGYVNHIIVDLNGDAITIERDEEGNYRALGDAEEMKNTNVDVDLIKEIITVLEAL